VTKTRCMFLGKTIGFLLGCSVLAVFLLLGTGIYFFFEYVVDWRIQRASQTTPVKIADPSLSSDEVRSLKLRVEGFIKERTQAKKPTPLKLSADELTALVVSSFPQDTSSRIRFEFEDEGLFIRGSIDLTEWGYDGRYLNGHLWVFIEKVSGRFRFRLADIKGHEDVWISGKSLRALRLENLSGYAYRHPQLSPILQKTDYIELQDQAIILFPKT